MRSSYEGADEELSKLSKANLHRHKKLNVGEVLSSTLNYCVIVPVKAKLNGMRHLISYVISVHERKSR